MTRTVTTKYLIEILEDTHSRTLELLEGLDPYQLMGPKLPIVNPILWEIGHVAWFTERFVLRNLHKLEPIMPELDEVYDSIAIQHSV